MGIFHHKHKKWEIFAGIILVTIGTLLVLIPGIAGWPLTVAGLYMLGHKKFADVLKNRATGFFSTKTADKTSVRKLDK